MYRAAVAGSGFYMALPFFDHKIKLFYEDTPENRQLIEDVPSIAKGGFFPTPYLASGVLQALFGSSNSKLVEENNIVVNYERQLLTAPDGGTLSIDWAAHKNPKGLLLVIPGLTGGSEAHYIMSLVAYAQSMGYVVGVFHGRGIEGTPLTTPKGNHLGNLEDLEMGIKAFQIKYPTLPLVGIGTSMGGNLILKYAGARGAACVFKGIVAISTPFDILICSRYLRQQWPSTILSDNYITDNMVRVFKDNSEAVEWFRDMGIDIEKVLVTRRSFDFDSLVTTKVLGYQNAEHYYRDISCVQDLHKIETPVLAMSSLDDPVVTKDCIPYEEFRTNKNLILAVTRCGGHIGWFSGFFKPKRWYVKPTIEFLDTVLKL